MIRSQLRHKTQGGGAGACEVDEPWSVWGGPGPGPREAWGRFEVGRDKWFVDKELPMSIRSRKLASDLGLGPPHHTIYNPLPPPQAHKALVSLEC